MNVFVVFNFDASSMSQNHSCSKLWSKQRCVYIYMYIKRCGCSCTNCDPEAAVPFLWMSQQVSNGALHGHSTPHRAKQWHCISTAPIGTSNCLLGTCSGPSQNHMSGCETPNMNHDTGLKVLDIMRTRVVKDWSMDFFLGDHPDFKPNRRPLAFHPEASSA